MSKENYCSDFVNYRTSKETLLSILDKFVRDNGGCLVISHEYREDICVFRRKFDRPTYIRE